MSKTSDKKEAARKLFLTETLKTSEIAQKLGIAVGTLNRWSWEGNWVEQKRSGVPPESVKYVVANPEVVDRTVATPTAVTVVPEELEPDKEAVVEKWEALAGEHERSYAELRKYAQHQIRTLTRKTAKLQAIKDTDTLEAIALSLPVAKAATEWGKLLDLAIKGERVVTSAHYYDINNAIGLIRKYGYDIVAPLPVDQPDETDSTENTQGISPETSDRILRESLGIEPDSTELPEEMDA